MMQEIFRFILKLLLVAVLTIVGKFLFEYFHLRYQFRKVPGITGLPFVGIALELLKVPFEDQQEWFSKITEQYKGNVFQLWIGPRPFINLQKPRHMEIILPSTVNIKKSFVYDIIMPWLGNGLLTSTGEKWFHQRRLLTPAFHFGVLEKFTDVMYEKSLTLNDCLSKFVRENPGKSVEIFDYVSMYTLDTICETAMGVDMDAERESANAYFKAVHEFSNLAADRYIRPWYMWDFIYFKTNEGRKFKETIRVMHEFTSKVIKEKVEKRKNSSPDEDLEGDDFVLIGKRKRKAFLDILLEASENDEHPLSVDEIREQVDTFMFAGHDTTATAITWTLFAIGNAPEVQEKIHEELRDVFGDDADKPATSAELTQLKYLDRVIKEALRLYPSAPFIFRDLCEDVVFDGHKIPAGTAITINIFDLHRDAEVWENPLHFDPDRFLPDDFKRRHPYSYIPFSAGPRNCIGQKFANLEAKIALSTILRKWNISSFKSLKEIKLQTDLILRCSEPIKLHLTPITNT